MVTKSMGDIMVLYPIITEIFRYIIIKTAPFFFSVHYFFTLFFYFLSPTSVYDRI